MISTGQRRTAKDRKHARLEPERTFYRFHPALDTSRIALIQSGVWIFGTIILTCGVAAIYLGRPEMEPIAIIGALTVLRDMLAFAYLVFRSELTVVHARRATAPAE